VLEALDHARAFGGGDLARRGAGGEGAFDGAQVGRFFTRPVEEPGPPFRVVASGGGEEIIVNPPAGLKDGDKVKLK
jgi:hypothetical protein